MFQSTLPRGERQQPVRTIEPVNIVSIHVPTRGTTGVPGRSYPGEGVSIHVPTRGTTLAFIDDLIIRDVSIHVPTRGTTVLKYLKMCFWGFQSTFPRGERHNFYFCVDKFVCFNPRSHEGNDQAAWLSDIGYRSFNPRSHEGNDLHQMWRVKYHKGFNPRSHEGNDDPCIHRLDQLFFVSIHVPTRGTTTHMP